MKKLVLIITFQSFLGVLFLNAQQEHNPNRPSIREHNWHSNCAQPFSETHFNRDYQGLSNISLRYRDYEIRSYLRYKCLSSDQLRRLALLYATDRERERFLMYAFNFVFDLEDYSVTASSLVTIPTRNDYYQFLASKGIPTGDLVYVYPPNYNPYYPNNYPNNNVYPPPPNTNGNYNNNYPNTYPNTYPNNNGNNNNYPPQTNNGNNSNNGNYNNYPPQTSNAGGNNNYPNSNNGNNNAGYPPSPSNNGYTLEPQTGSYTPSPPTSNTNTNGNNLPNNNNNNYAPNNRPMMSFTNFENLKTQISHKSFEKERVELANQTVTQNFLTSSQIAGIMRLLSFDSNRFDFAKYAYPYVFDKENYSTVGDALSFDSNKKALKDFLSGSTAKH